MNTPRVSRTLGGGGQASCTPLPSITARPPLTTPQGWDLAPLMGAEVGMCWDEDICRCLQGSCHLLLLCSVRHIAALRSRTTQASLGVFLLLSLPADSEEENKEKTPQRATVPPQAIRPPAYS